MPSAKARDFQRVAVALGFLRTGQKGSHEVWEHGDGRIVTIPLFYKILRQLGITLGEFQKLR